MKYPKRSQSKHAKSQSGWPWESGPVDQIMHQWQTYWVRPGHLPVLVLPYLSTELDDEGECLDPGVLDGEEGPLSRYRTPRGRDAWVE